MKLKYIDVEEFKRLYVSGISAKEMRQKYGVTDCTLNNWRKKFCLNRPRVRPDLRMKNLGVDRSGQNNGNFGNRKVNKTILKRLFKIYGDYGVVAKKLGIATSSMLKYRREYGLEGVMKRAYVKKDYLIARERAFKRDVCCVLCASMKRLNAHHIDYDEEGTNDKRIVTLCNGCHASTNKSRDLWVIVFKRLLQYRYGIVYMNEGGDDHS